MTRPERCPACDAPMLVDIDPAHPDDYSEYECGLMFDNRTGEIGGRCARAFDTSVSLRAAQRAGDAPSEDADILTDERLPRMPISSRPVKLKLHFSVTAYSRAEKLAYRLAEFCNPWNEKVLDKIISILAPALSATPTPPQVQAVVDAARNIYHKLMTDVEIDPVTDADHFAEQLNMTDDVIRLGGALDALPPSLRGGGREEK